MLPPTNLVDVRARYNRKWSLWLLLLNAVLLLNLPEIEWLNASIGKYSSWVLAGLIPWVVLVLAGAVVISLPKSLRRPVYVIMGLLLAVSAFITVALIAF